MRASQVNVGIGFDAVTVEKMMTNASKPVEFNFAGMKLLIAHRKSLLKLIARLWHKRRRPKSYVFAFFGCWLVVKGRTQMCPNWAQIGEKNNEY